MKPSDILDKISTITSELALDYPEIFRTLVEENFFLGSHDFQTISEKDLNMYLDSLKNILDSYKKNHQDKLSIYPK